MRTPNLYLVQDGHALWLEPAVDAFGDSDVELHGCTIDAAGTLDLENAYRVDQPGDFDVERLVQIDVMLRTLASTYEPLQ